MADLDFVDQQPNVAAPARPVTAVTKLVRNQRPESLDYPRLDREAGIGQLPFEMIDIDIDAPLLGRDVAEFGCDPRIDRAHDAAPDQLDNVGAFAIKESFAGTQLFELGAAFGNCRLATVEPRLKQCCQSARSSTRSTSASTTMVSSLSILTRRPLY